MSHVKTLYEPRMARVRALVAGSPLLRRMQSPQAPRRVTERFLIEYCSLGVQITEPVESWISRAGQACIDSGLEQIGQALRDHARHEASHQEMFIADTQKLVSRYNTAYGTSLSADALIARPATPAMCSYIDLHEDTIASDLPAGQVAIELEIERLSVEVLPALLTHWEGVLGKEALSALSFLTSHAQLDIGHTHLNTRLMEQVLDARPGAVGDLARIGAEALFIYMAFFEECWEAAEDACHGEAALEANPLPPA